MKSEIMEESVPLSLGLIVFNPLPIYSFRWFNGNFLCLCGLFPHFSSAFSHTCRENTIFKLSVVFFCNLQTSFHVLGTPSHTPPPSPLPQKTLFICVIMPRQIAFLKIDIMFWMYISPFKFKKIFKDGSCQSLKFFI